MSRQPSVLRIISFQLRRLLWKGAFVVTAIETVFNWRLTTENYKKGVSKYGETAKYRLDGS